MSDSTVGSPMSLSPDERDAAIERASARGAYWTGSRLFVALSAMLFGAGVFAYFYLHSLDSNTLWRAPGQRPSDFIAIPVLVMTMVGAGLFWVYTRSLHSSGRARSTDWRVATAAATVMFLTAGLLQLWGMNRTGFAAGSSGYASVYTATMPVFAVYCLGCAYWLETLFARSLRVRWLLTPEGANRESDEAVAFTGSAVGARLFVVFVALVGAGLYVHFSVLN
jgi:heme/copper-type cytochrome/quinol oxidase subunit 3